MISFCWTNWSISNSNKSLKQHELIVVQLAELKFVLNQLLGLLNVKTELLLLVLSVIITKIQSLINIH